MVRLYWPSCLLSPIFYVLFFSSCVQFDFNDARLINIRFRPNRWLILRVGVIFIVYGQCGQIILIHGPQMIGFGNVGLEM